MKKTALKVQRSPEPGHLFYRMDPRQHIESDLNEQVGDRPIRTNINRIVFGVLAIVAIVLLAAWLLVGVRGRSVLPGHNAIPAAGSPQ